MINTSLLLHGGLSIRFTKKHFLNESERHGHE